MTHAVEIEDLARFAEGTLHVSERERVRSHVDGCIECRSQLADLRAIDRMVGPADPGAMGRIPDADISAPLERRLDAILRRVIGGEVDTRPGRPWWARPRWITGFLAVAASIVLTVMLRHDAALPPELQGRVVLTSQSETVRSGRQPSFHLELTLGRTGFVAVFQASPQGLRLIFPSPNPVLGTFGITDRIAKGTPVRIPPSAVADYPAAQLSPGSRLFAAMLTQLPTTAAMQAVVDEINREGHPDVPALQQALSARLGPVTILDAP